MLEPILILDSEEHWQPVNVTDSLSLHGYEWRGNAWLHNGAPVDRLDLPADMKQPVLPATGYHRRVEAAGLSWHQFWSWWLYNPKVYAGRGAHEGDWEMVQIAMAGDRPVLMTCSQHSGGEKREFWRVSLDTVSRPLVYVARDSHANYFAPERDVTDVADGKGARLDTMTWLEFEDGWEGWPGVWGNSENSPGGLSSRRAWTAPHAYHGQARG